MGDAKLAETALYRCMVCESTRWSSSGLRRLGTCRTCETGTMELVEPRILDLRRPAADEPGPLAGCGDARCILRPPGGVGTNGGCRCASPYDRTPQELARTVRAMAAELRAARAAADAAYRRGAEEMRERAADACDARHDAHMAAARRSGALPAAMMCEERALACAQIADAVRALPVESPDPV